jgi:hypothetical protein
MSRRFASLFALFFAPADGLTTGCATGDSCTFCWGSYACIPEYAMC